MDKVVDETVDFVGFFGPAIQRNNRYDNAKIVYKQVIEQRTLRKVVMVRSKVSEIVWVQEPQDMEANSNFTVIYMLIYIDKRRSTKYPSESPTHTHTLSSRLIYILRANKQLIKQT